MNKTTTLLIIFFTLSLSEAFAQLAKDGSYIWNVLNVSYSINDKTDLVLSNKNHYSNQTDRVDFSHTELTAYRKISPKFSVGLGYRQTESYKIQQWVAGHNYLLYGVYLLTPGNVKIKFTNRLAYKTFKAYAPQYTFDNITTVDLFVRSVSKLPKPYLNEEMFSELKSLKVQNFRLYGGFHLFKREHWGVDMFYCYWKTRPAAEWKNYNVFGLSSKFSI